LQTGGRCPFETTESVNKNKNHMNSKTALSNTLGFDSGELNSYQYQAGVFRRAIYSVDDKYFCLGKRAPKSEGMNHLSELVWDLYTDQFWAEKANTKIWVAKIK
jgi:hypothetical protein